MAGVKLSLPIYGENDEILKTYETTHIRWRMFTEAARLNEELQSMSDAEQLEVVGDFIKSLFVGLTDEELGIADAEDIFNTFKMVVKMAGKLNTRKNA